MNLQSATAFTMNCPGALHEIYHQSQTSSNPSSSTGQTDAPAIASAELIREVGLKCISLNGVAISINCMSAFHKALPSNVVQQLSQRKAVRHMSRQNIDHYLTNGQKLWNSIYGGFADSLYQKLSQVHPDLAPYILYGHYAGVLSEIETNDQLPQIRLGRVLTSILAVCALRAQTGVAPQVTSHLFGLRNAFSPGAAENPHDPQGFGGEWLASDEGNCWILESVDKLKKGIMV